MDLEVCYGAYKKAEIGAWVHTLFDLFIRIEWVRPTTHSSGNIRGAPHKSYDRKRRDGQGRRDGTGSKSRERALLLAGCSKKRGYRKQQTGTAKRLSPSSLLSLPFFPALKTAFSLRSQTLREDWRKSHLFYTNFWFHVPKTEFDLVKGASRGLEKTNGADLRIICVASPYFPVSHSSYLLLPWWVLFKKTQEHDGCITLFFISLF